MTRRTLTKSAAWGVPVIAAAVALPASSASTNCVPARFDAPAPGTGANQTEATTTTFVVPQGVTSLSFTVAGGAGGARNGYDRSRARLVQGTLQVTPGDVLTLIVGQGGYKPQDLSSAAGWYGGQGYGNGGHSVYTPEPGAGTNLYGAVGGSGGGGSAILLGSTPLVVAGGAPGQGHMTGRVPQSDPDWIPYQYMVWGADHGYDYIQGSWDRHIYAGFGKDASGATGGSGGTVPSATSGDPATLGWQNAFNGASGAGGVPGNGANGLYNWVESQVAGQNARVHASSAAGGGGYAGGGSGNVSRAYWSGTYATVVAAVGDGGYGSDYLAPTATGTTGVTDVRATTGTRTPGWVTLQYEVCT
ncbi:hypothetical protein PTQ19_11770 [Microbacterium esteraromaticum]|uniref:hypothetical protein n=1 Tax=Microbacterium esteraromaticum TaxID=57043 RepID=UPI00236890DF|nr:hypothetical protein [Microbacterium esteraromaticum]WDH78190.1 hypothetical protein PTQ19_11770 [Microbacterium esteraromaticum]